MFSFFEFWIPIVEIGARRPSGSAKRGDRADDSGQRHEPLAFK
jgi:hypothetical protein